VTLEEYLALPINDPDPIAIGSKYRFKSDREFKAGDIVCYFEVINVTKKAFSISHEAENKFIRLTQGE
jgi:hypothetical protein